MEMEEPSGGESRWSRLAPSLPVRNVQALAACAEELTAATLERYIRLDIHNDEVLDEQSGEVPVIDLARLLHPDSVEEEAARLSLACEDWGFFQAIDSAVIKTNHKRIYYCSNLYVPSFARTYHAFDLINVITYFLSLILVNHGIQEEIITNIRSDIQKFFQLPLEMKNAYSQRPGDIQGYGQSFVVSESQTLDWADMFGILAQPPQARDMRYWPTQPHTFRKYIEDYSSELMKVAHSVVTFIAKTLNVDLELMRDKYVSQFFRMNYYPPCMSMPEKVLGFSPHSDASFLTLLLEVTPVAGLQIKRHNTWIPVKPNPKALLVNVGDFLEIMSNGKYKSSEHRVTINPNQERLTISAFHVPSLDGIISPVTGSTEEMILYKTVAVEEYAKLYMSNKLDGKRALDHAKLF